MTSNGSYDLVPLVLTLVLFCLICMGLLILFFKYQATRRDLEFCQTFRSIYHQSLQSRDHQPAKASKAP